MDASPDHYRTLGVAPDAPPAVVRAAYVALSKIHHPDGGTDPDHRRMQDINRAWATLRDPARRRDYDAARARARAARVARARADRNGGGGAPPRPGGGPAPGRGGWGEDGDDGDDEDLTSPGRRPPAGGRRNGGDDPTPPAGRPRARFRRAGRRTDGRAEADADADTAGDPVTSARSPGRDRAGQRPGSRRRWADAPRTPPQGQEAIDDDLDADDTDADADAVDTDADLDDTVPGDAGWGEEVDDDPDDDAFGDERDPTAVTARRVVAFGLDLVAVGALAYGLWRILVFGVYHDVPKPDRAQAVDTCTYVARTTADCHAFGNTAYYHDSYWPIALAILVPLVLIHVVLQGRTGATPGKALMGLRTVKEDGAPPGYMRATVRTALLVAVDTAVWCLPIVGISQVRTTLGHRRVGDRIARTYVVGMRSAGRPIVVPPPLPPPPDRYP